MSPDALETDRPSHRQPTTNDSRVATIQRQLGHHERTLWVLLAAVCCADLLTTYYGVHNGLVEGNPIVRSTLADGGFAAFTLLKLAMVSFATSVWVLMSRPNRVVVPLGLTLPWAATSLTNAVAILA